MKKFIETTPVAMFIVLIALAFASCTKEKETDTVPPIIDMVLPQEGDTLFINEVAHLEINISDERELDSCRFEVHANFDNHNHKSVLNGDKPWFYSRTFYLAGIKSTTLHDYAFHVPDAVGFDLTAQGNYHFVVDCWDKAGNHSAVLLNIRILAKQH